MGCNCGGKNKAAKQAQALEVQQKAEAARLELQASRQSVAQDRRAARDAKYAKLGVKT
jgi:hypothetical protein